MHPKRHPTPLALILSLLLFAVSARAELLLHYRLAEGTGRQAADTSSAPSPALLRGEGAGWSSDTPSGSGSALHLAAPHGGHLAAGNIAKLGALRDFTATFWIKLSDIASGDRVFSTRSPASMKDGVSGFVDVLAASGSSAEALSLQLQFRDNEGKSATVVSAPFDARDWVFVAIVREGRSVTFFTASAASGSAPTSIGGKTRLPAAGPVNASAGEFQLAGTAATARNRHPSGSFADFRLHDEALSPEALARVRLAALDTTPAPAAVTLAGAECWDAIYHFGDGATTTAAGGPRLHRAVGAYNANRGFGFTRDSDDEVAENNRVFFRKRDASLRGTVAIDSRHYGKPALDRPPYTLRIDLPNGWYRVGLAVGDPAGGTALLAHVGDTFAADGVSLDETAETTVNLFAGNEIASKGDLIHRDQPFEVRDGYLLVGFRRPTHSRVRWAALASVSVAPIAPSSGDATAMRWLIRQGVGQPRIATAFEGPAADYIQTQWASLMENLTWHKQAARASDDAWLLDFRLATDPDAAARLARAGISAEQLGQDGFALVPSPKGVSVIAPRPYGLVSGLFEVVRLSTGHDWVRPLAGERPLSPVRQAFLRLDAPVVRKPAFALRGQALTQYDSSREFPHYWDWLVRNGYNFSSGSLTGERYRAAEHANAQRGMVHNFLGHTLHELVPASKYFKTHPEYFPVIDGQSIGGEKGGSKGAQINMAHPGVVDVVTRELDRYLAEEPSLKIVSMGVNDTGGDGTSGYGQGADELAMDDPRDLQQFNLRGPRSYSTRYIKFSNAVAEKLAVSHPDAQINLYAYHETLPPPFVTPHPNLLIQFSPLYKSMNQPMRSQGSGRNRMVDTWLRGWRDLTDNIIVRDYYVMYSRAGRAVLPVSLYVVSDDIRYYRDLGLRGVVPEVIPDGPDAANADPAKPYPPFVFDPVAYEQYWDASWLVHHGLGRLMWDPDASVRSIIDHACATYYGPAAAPMAEYHDRLHRHAYQSGRPDEVLREDQIKKTDGGRVWTGPHDRTWNWRPSLRDLSETLFDVRYADDATTRQRLTELATLLAEARELARQSGVRGAIERVERDVDLFDRYTASLGYGFRFMRGRLDPVPAMLPDSAG